MIDYAKVIRGQIYAHEVTKKDIANNKSEVEHHLRMATQFDSDNAEYHLEIAKCFVSLIDAQQKYLSKIENEIAEWYFKLSDAAKISA